MQWLEMSLHVNMQNAYIVIQTISFVQRQFSLFSFEGNIFTVIERFV